MARVLLIGLEALAVLVLLALLWRLLVPSRPRHPEPEPEPTTPWGWIARGVRRGLELLARTRDRGGAWATWSVEVVGPDGKVKDARYLPRTRVNLEAGRNLIVNAGLEWVKARLHDPATVLTPTTHVAIGTGAVPETPADVGLGAEVVRGVVTYTPGGVGTCVVERTFPAAGGYEPVAVTEAGLFADPVGPPMFNRKVFPAVNKTAADTLKVTCTITWTAA